MLGGSRLLRATTAKRFGSTASQRFVEAKCLEYDVTNSANGFNANEPVIFKNCFKRVPAIGKWFIPSASSPNLHELNISYLDRYGDSIVSLELTQTTPDNTTSFQSLQAPLSVLLAHMTSPDTPMTRLYLAQHSLDDLPKALQSDLPTPTLLSQLGHGDIYASSLWMGKPPTRTPLHRDPNPNLFGQLAGEKIIRLFRPEIGRAVFERVQAKLGKKGGRANMRGAEMMEGEELEALEQAVWGCSDAIGDALGVQAELGSGDGLYIPLGWWHAVRGIGQGANASVSRHYALYNMFYVANYRRRSIGGSADVICFRFQLNP